MSLPENKDFSLEAVQVWRSQDLVEYVLADLDTRIKKDKPVKLSVFFTGLSAFTREPINLFLKGESGIGKSFNTTETLRPFPQENVWYLGGMSRKSLVHSYGVLLNKHGEEIDLDSGPVKPEKKDYRKEKEFDEAAYNEARQEYKDELKAWRQELRESYTLVDLSHKILVFLESPDYETFQMLRPILSHDKEEIEFMFVDKTGKGQLQTKRVKLRGWPATIFLTSDSKYIEELATRSFTATPEDSELKISEANVLTNMKASLPWKYEEETKGFRVVRSLLERLKDLLGEGKFNVVVPFLNLSELFPKQITRDMRDFQHFCQFLKTITVLHFFQRAYLKTDAEKLLISTVQDVKQALDVYKAIFETTRTGTEQRILKFYHDIIKDLTMKDEDGKVIGTRSGWYLKNLTEAYNKKYRKKLSEESVRLMLERLDQIGYVNTEKDTLDKRKNLYVPLMKGEEKDKNPLENSSCSDLDAKLKNGFETWTENIRQTTSLYYYKNLPEKLGTWGEDNITLDDLSKLVLEGQNIFSSNQAEGICRIISNEDSNRNLATMPEIKQKPDSRRILDNSTAKPESNLGIPCPQCQALGKKVYFANDIDLRIHISAYHESQDYVR